MFRRTTKLCHECRALQFRFANDSHAAVIGISVLFPCVGPVPVLWASWQGRNGARAGERCPHRSNENGYHMLPLRERMHMVLK